MRRRLLASLAALVALGALVPATAVGSQESEVTIRIVAQRLEDGRVEFGIQQQLNGTWGDRLLPRARYFPAGTEVGRWLRSSPIDLTSAGTPQAAPAPRSGLYVADSYWSDDRDEYFVVVGGLSSSHTYCEVHLTRDGRRIGEWSNELWSGSRSEVIVTIYLGPQFDSTFDGVDVECS
ncbi:MAG: hypothetical protein OXG55_06780 [bacterium]|nr:hypothetical protein [bacterium]